ncbi:acylphosphatase [Lactobacillus sp. YT155]|uniref:acylphosphatase n=1 Tax=Lactobacillus sp. YT155 TaxID=3060955 RepID=UPI00265EA04B|nr:acylphosphatase [Lactobacillus sp. YT155]MDO1605587.1 acylphosphatase [Lactobacillus sp. YT155]
MTKNVSLIASGLVQGVGFRFSTKMVADDMDVVGTVKNNIDGTVSIEAQGPDDVIDEFIKKIKQGPSAFAKVKHLEITENEELKNFTNFSVIG